MKAAKRKDDHIIKNMYQTQVCRGYDENRNILNEYKDEIELLKLDNQRLKADN